MATFLEILEQVADELGLVRPTDVTASDLQTRQLVGLANRTGADLMKEVDWTSLQTEYVIEFNAPTELTGDITDGSAVVAGISDTSALSAATFHVAGTGIQQATRIASVDSATQVTLTQEATATTTGVTLTFTKDTFDIPTDFDRYIDQTQWDRRFQWELIGPQSPQADQQQRSGIVAFGPRRKYRQVGRRPSAFRIWPPPSASGEYPGTLVWEYISNQWVNKSDSTFASTLTANDDETVFPDGLLVLGIKWRFWQAKGFAYADRQAEYIDWLNRESARDGGQRPIGLSRRARQSVLLTSANAQDGSFPDRSNL
jgi:hypothetical protein